MRMWNVDSALLCNKHLAGEHVEMHMFIGTVRKGVSLDGYVSGGLVEVHNIVTRHDAVAAEMVARGMNHQSPVSDDDREMMADLPPRGEVDVTWSKTDLCQRCSACSERIAGPVLDCNGDRAQFRVSVEGRPFACECGCNVFHKPDR